MMVSNHILSMVIGHNLDDHSNDHYEANIDTWDWLTARNPEWQGMKLIVQKYMLNSLQDGCHGDLIISQC